jgi:long-chain acyl-CoA synthetase
VEGPLRLSRARHTPGGPLRLDYTEPTWAARRRTFVTERHRLNYSNFIDRLADLYGRRSAFALDTPMTYPGFHGDVLSYRDVARLVNRMAQALRAMGVERGDRVGLMTMNRIEMAFVNFAAGKIGAIPVPMNFMLRPNEIEHIVQVAGIEVLVCDPLVFEATIRDRAAVSSVKTWAMVGEGTVPEGVTRMAELMEDAADFVPSVEPDSEDDVALLFFTSGTTGFPKGAMITQAGSMVFLRYHGRMFAMSPRMPRQLSLLVMPVAHAGGYAAMIAQLTTGTPAFFMSTFDPAGILGAIQRYRATMMSGTPAMYRMLMDAGIEDYDLSSIRVWAGGADAFSDDLVRRMRGLAARPGPAGRERRPLFIRGYGMAETNSYLAQAMLEAGDNCLGWVLPPVTFRIVGEDGRDVPRGEVGELWVRGPNVTRGYWNDPVATAQAISGPWLRTGDMVRQGKWRMLYFVDRAGDVIKSGGYKISAAEIDQALCQHPDVEHAATVGIPDAVKGERPMAAVVLAPGASATAEEILEWARERIAPYKCPRRIFVMPDLPFTFSVKPKHHEVRERVLAVIESEREAD